MLPTRRGSNPQPPYHQSDARPTEPPRRHCVTVCITGTFSVTVWWRTLCIIRPFSVTVGWVFCLFFQLSFYGTVNLWVMSIYVTTLFPVLLAVNQCLCTILSPETNTAFLKGREKITVENVLWWTRNCVVKCILHYKLNHSLCNSVVKSILHYKNIFCYCVVKSILRYKKILRVTWFQELSL